MGVGIGIDPHKSTITAASADELGRLGVFEEFPNDPSGHEAVWGWVRARGDERIIGIECSGTYGAALARFLLAAGEDVREVPPAVVHKERSAKPSKGKSDVVDALAAARAVVRDDTLSSVRLNPVAEELGLLTTRRDQLKCARNQAQNRAHAQLMVLRPGYQEKVARLTSKEHRRQARLLIRSDHSLRAVIVRDLLNEIGRLESAMDELEAQIRTALKHSGTSLLQVIGVGPVTAAKIISEVGDIRHFRSKAAFAMFGGTAPLEASSGPKRRHRLNRGGNRQLNYALHMVAVTRRRADAESKAYVARQIARGKTDKEAMRALKRHLSNRIYRCLVNDSFECQSGGLTT
jgi:transposase